MLCVRAGRVGHWGEKACYEHLLRFFSDDPSVEVEWLNEETETGLPYVRELECGERGLDRERRVGRR